MIDEKRFWNKKELAHFLQHCRHDADPMTYPLFRMLAWSGLRASELLVLMPEDVKGKMVHVPEVPETVGSRYVALDPDTEDALLAWMKPKTDGSVIFPTSLSAMKEKLDALSQELYLPPIDLEDFRSMLKINLRHEGISEIAIDDRLG